MQIVNFIAVRMAYANSHEICAGKVAKFSRDTIGFESGFAIQKS